MLGLGLGTLIAEILSFLVFLYVMSRLSFGFPMITRIITERRQRIETSLQAAADEHQKAEELRASLEAQVAETRAEARRILEEAERAAAEEGRRLVEEARLQADGLVRAGREEIQAEQARAVREIRDQVVELSLAVSRKILERELDDATHRRLIDEYIGRAVPPQ